MRNSAAAHRRPWVEKYRPKQLDDVAAHKSIIDTSEEMTCFLGRWFLVAQLCAQGGAL